MTNLDSAKKAYQTFHKRMLSDLFEETDLAKTAWDNLPEYAREAWIAATNSIMADACDDIRRTLRQASRALRDGG